ncbi:thymidine phosphorylase [Lysinibacillus sp. 3P01SB]|uniref:thymidine phosphorylase n=1 Tax=Lysinibacillus sp. 3P01SB TaxID=3132284 RepID=UPI0039A46E83
MNILSIIEKKKNKQPLTKEEIRYFINGYTKEEIPDYQISSLLMAIRLNGMEDEEMFYLTEAMVNSGDIIDLSDIKGFKVDKHSTGGVGDKVTLVVAPILAALDIPVAKFSGRGLGITGGTVDKLESIEGFHVELSQSEFIENVKKHGIAVAGQTGNLCPADKKLYALRDVTGTVDSIPLIASSIISKKIASGSDGIVLDVKYGNGAFMKTKEEAKVLADKMAEIGKRFGRKIVYTLSDMNNPLGRFIGNKVEVVEALDVLSGNVENTHEDLVEDCVEVASLMYMLATDCSKEEAAVKVREVIENGKAKDKFLEFVKAQGGNVADLKAKGTAVTHHVKAAASGQIASVNALAIGELSVMLGAGRLTKESKLDFDAGIKIIAKTGDSIQAGDTLAILFSNIPVTDEMTEKATAAFQIK